MLISNVLSVIARPFGLNFSGIYLEDIEHCEKLVYGAFKIFQDAHRLEPLASGTLILASDEGEGEQYGVER